ncbi:glycosyltransferase [Thermoplasmatales archaeon SCGC AB-539-N05]|nr:glycosyltransferase [Thermoplasmatales archaeon SCGC AB-539-N05]
MKICMVISTQFPPKEGIGYYTYNLSKKLIEKGHKVVVITRGSWFKTQKQVLDGIEIIKTPFIPIYPFHLRLQQIFTKKAFKSLEPDIDIVHLHTPLPPFIKTSHPVVLTIHTPMLSDNNYIKTRSIHSLLTKISARFVSYPLELKLIKSSDMVTTVSHSVAKELKEYGLNQEDISVVYNGVDEKFFYPKQTDSANDNKYIMYAGRIDREKGLFDLLECAKSICSERSDVSFIVAGNGRDLNRLNKKIKNIGIQDKFILVGQAEKDHLVKLYQNATLFVLPSYHEGLPTVLLEAMSCGLPVIATDVRGNRDLVSNGKNGIIIPSRAPKKMADAITMLLEDKNLRKKLGKNARKTIEQKYTWNKVSSKLLRCYKSLVEVKA